MSLYMRVSGAFFVLLAAAQLTRTVFRWPVQVADVEIPVWVSGFAFAIASGLAFWALRSAKGAA